MPAQGMGRPASFRGAWLQNPRFRGLPYRQQIHDERQPQFRSEIQNVHTLYRKSFDVPGAVRQALLHITADDAYKLHLNGHFVGTGPAPSFLFRYRYNTYDVTDIVRAGGNCLAAQVYYQGLYNIAYTSADNLQGLLCQIDIELMDGSRLCIASDGSFRMLECAAWPGAGTRAFGYETHVAEDVDLRLYPYGWTENAYDDAAWTAPHVAAVPCPPYYALAPQETASPDVYELSPASMRRTDDGRVILDMGKEIVGCTRVRAIGPAGHALIVRHAEEMQDDDHIRWQMRCNCAYEETLTLSGRPGGDDFTFFEFKGFRYIELCDLPGDPDDVRVTVMARNYPFVRGGEMHADSPVLRDIWSICEQGVKVGTQDAYLDCPTREKGGFLGDALITSLSHLILTGDPAIYRKFIVDMCDSARINPVVCAEMPTYIHSAIGDYSMIVPLIAYHYAMWTGDLGVLRMALPVCEGVLAYIGRAMNADGLLENVAALLPSSHIFVMIDWPENLRDGYEMDGARERVCAVTNLFYFGCLKQTAELYALVGDTARAAELRARADRLGAAIIGALYDRERGVFVDHDGTRHASLHAQALPLLFGLDVPLGNAPLVAFIREKRIACGVYFAYHVLHGLMRANAYDLAAELLLCDDEHGWVNMLRAGATTCMEAWGPDQKWNTSWCHPWSSTPIIALWRMLGIEPLTPGFAKVRIMPRVPARLGDLSLSFTTPQGPMRASMRGERYEIELPARVEALLDLPGEEPRRVSLDAGRHVFVVAGCRDMP